MESTYLLVFIILIILIVSISIYLYVKKDNVKQKKDENLKIMLNLLKKEKYENPDDSNRNKTKCLQIKSNLGDSNTKGLNDIYKNIMGEKSPLSSSSINCDIIDEIDNKEINKLKSSVLDLINEMIYKSIENKDEEKVYYDLSSLYIGILKVLDGAVKVKDNLDSNGNIISLEIKTPNDKDLTISDLYNFNYNHDSNNTGMSHKISKQVSDTKTKISSLKLIQDIKDKDINNLKNDNNPQINIISLGKILFLILSKKGTFFN